MIHQIAHGRMARLPYFLAVAGLVPVLLLIQAPVMGLANFTASGEILNLLWRGDYAAYGAAVDAAVHQAGRPTVHYAVFGVSLICLFSTFLFLSARRLRDIGRPGRYALIALLPFVGAPALFAVLMLLPGDTGSNRYGPGRSPDTPSDANTTLTTEPAIRA